MSLISDTTRAELARAYAAPDRHYHNLAHIETLLDLARQHGDGLADTEAIEAAIWFHDAVYDSRHHDNEANSAALAIERLCSATSPDRANHEVAARRNLTRSLATLVSST